ncbi:uncharacterized protein BO80DRAFT_292817 [Aspergillus ibericus CBS 121593]|uniref:Uncharacterized protein n=1 Tax=Aspergillus ibericus CBS 121593 TaxID=1448316 RepID=A0A395GHJ3_9EURO|nr:hypothetical protein BO80DRAFT_292817 [Aspergillus ibericus CBS 121593]RAK94869.1 hypothetical protein BO80DRAFT_292817 [Aspergillus ibericus CBS 121593]
MSRNDRGRYTPFVVCLVCLRHLLPQSLISPSARSWVFPACTLVIFLIPTPLMILSLFMFGRCDVMGTELRMLLSQDVPSVYLRCCCVFSDCLNTLSSSSSLLVCFNVLHTHHHYPSEREK